ncbi:MAG: hypothetical protein WC390_10870 [Sulfurimonas sp.]|jgi:hypothetical protein
MKKIIFFLFLVFKSLNADGTYADVYFTDYEENSSLYFCNYYNYNDFLNLGVPASIVDNITFTRISTPFTSLQQVADIDGVNFYVMANIRQQSHLIDWNIFTDDFGMTLHQTNFIYALTGVLVGFVFLLSFVFMIIF